MSRWVSSGNWARTKGSVSKQLQDKAGPRVRLGKSFVKRGGKLAVGKSKRTAKAGGRNKRGCT